MLPLMEKLAEAMANTSKQNKDGRPDGLKQQMLHQPAVCLCSITPVSSSLLLRTVVPCPDWRKFSPLEPRVLEPTSLFVCLFPAASTPLSQHV